MDDLKEYPSAGGVRLNARAAVWLNRERAAYRLAELKGGPVTVAAFEEAYKLYMRFIRFALASYREAENDNDRRAYKPDGTPRAWHAEEAARNERRAAAIDRDLEPYGVKLVWCGMYPSICKVGPACGGVSEQITGYFF